MKATTMVLRQHDRVAQIVGAIEQEKHHRDALLVELVDEVTALLTTEETIFYPGVRDVAGLRVDEHREHHAQVRAALIALAAARADDHDFTIRVALLEDHLRALFSLERDLVLPIVESELGDFALEQLGKKMIEFQFGVRHDIRNTAPASGVRETLTVDDTRDSFSQRRMAHNQ